MFERLIAPHVPQQTGRPASALSNKATHWQALPEEIRLKILGDAVFSPVDRMRMGGVNRATRASVQASMPVGPALPAHPCRLEASVCRKHYSLRVEAYARAKIWLSEKLPTQSIDFRSDQSTRCGLFVNLEEWWYGRPLFDERFHFDLCWLYAEAGDREMLRLLYLLQPLAPDENQYQVLRANLHQSRRYLSKTESHGVMQVLPGRHSIEVDIYEELKSGQQYKNIVNVYRFRLGADNPERQLETLMSLIRVGTAEDVKMALSEGYTLPEQIYTRWTVHSRNNYSGTKREKKSIRYTNETPLSAAKFAFSDQPSRRTAQVVAVLLAAGAQPRASAMRRVWTRWTK